MQLTVEDTPWLGITMSTSWMPAGVWCYSLTDYPTHSRALCTNTRLGNRLLFYQRSVDVESCQLSCIWRIRMTVYTLGVCWKYIFLHEAVAFSEVFVYSLPCVNCLLAPWGQFVLVVIKSDSLVVDALMGSMTVHDIPLPSQPPNLPPDLSDVPLPPDEQPPLPPCPPLPDTDQVRQYGQPT